MTDVTGENPASQLAGQLLLARFRLGWAIPLVNRFAQFSCWKIAFSWAGQLRRVRPGSASWPRRELFPSHGRPL